MSVLAVFLSLFFMCTPDYHPSSPARFKRSKTVKVKKFPLFKIWTKSLYFDVDVLWQLLDPSGPPQRAESHPFKTSPYFFFISTVPYHQPFNFTCPIYSLFNTCATVIRQIFKTRPHFFPRYFLFIFRIMQNNLFLTYSPRFCTRFEHRSDFEGWSLYGHQREGVSSSRFVRTVGFIFIFVKFLPQWLDSIVENHVAGFMQFLITGCVNRHLECSASVTNVRPFLNVSNYSYTFPRERTLSP